MDHTQMNRDGALAQQSYDRPATEIHEVGSFIQPLPPKSLSGPPEPSRWWGCTGAPRFITLVLTPFTLGTPGTFVLTFFCLPLDPEDAASVPFTRFLI